MSVLCMWVMLGGVVRVGMGVVGVGVGVVRVLMGVVRVGGRVQVAGLGARRVRRVRRGCRRLGHCVAAGASVAVFAPQLAAVRLAGLPPLLGAASDVQQHRLRLPRALEHGRDQLHEAGVLGLLQPALKAVLHHSHELAVTELAVV